ncbi:MAG: acyl-CoA thioesterase [Microbacterium gubbeenense]|uniref:acyl-CoA thioesterase n=1 Tax=Microbacterium gubbeenense TaxID=159896 RepID=UPI000403F790|nr:thioesterase family protein [Microbacterium gubbeenense]
MRVHIPVQRRWGDQDALGHINNVSLLKILEEARLRAFWREGNADDSPVAVFDDDTVSTGGSFATLVARQEIEYLLPVPYARDPLDVQLWIGRLGGSTAEICYDVMSPASDADQVLYARSTVVVVLVDTTTGRPARLPQDIRAAWEPYVDDPITYRKR